MLMKTETINRKIYVKPAIGVLMLEETKPLLIDSDEYYYQGAPDDWYLQKTAATSVAAVFVCIICQIRISSGTFKRSYAAFERISLCEMKEKNENACVFQGKAVLLRR